jgi:hypothetical protein
VRCAQLRVDPAADDPVGVGGEVLVAVGVAVCAAPPGGVDAAVAGGTGDTGVDLRLVLDTADVDRDGDVAATGGDGLSVGCGGVEAGAAADGATVGAAVVGSGRLLADTDAASVVAVLEPPPAVEQETEPAVNSSARTATVQRCIDLRSQL